MKVSTIPLTIPDIRRIEKRVNEIIHVLNLCSNEDLDVIDNLYSELDYLVLQVSNSLKLLQRRRLKLVVNR